MLENAYFNWAVIGRQTHTTLRTYCMGPSSTSGTSRNARSAFKIGDRLKNLLWPGQKHEAEGCAGDVPQVFLSPRVKLTRFITY